MAAVNPRESVARDDLLRYFLRGARPRERWQIGMELEKMGVDAATGRRIPYDGARASVRSVLQAYLERRGGHPVYEGEHLIGGEGEWGILSLEPGGQVEWSSRPCSDLAQLARELEAHLGVLRDVGQACGVRWLERAVDSRTRLADVPWVPKARYKILAPYLRERGRLAHYMMTLTASIQCTYDYASPEDWARKFRAGALLAPIAVALFANSPEAEGRPTGYRSYRQRIWRETDPDRCGLPPVVFAPGFSLEAWLEWVLERPAIFLYRDGGLVPAGGVPFRRLMETGCCHPLTMEDWRLHLSAIFTEVRSYTYLELRSADLQPDDRILAVPAFWSAMFYDEQALAQALEIGAPYASHTAWCQAMEAAAREGLEGRAGGRSLRDLAAQALAVALRVVEGRAGFVGPSDSPVRALRALAQAVGLEEVVR